MGIISNLYYIAANPVDLNRVLTKSLLAGGPDDRYTLAGNDDLRQYNITAQFMIQVS